MKRLIALIALLCSAPAAAADILSIYSSAESERLFSAYIDCTLEAVERYIPVEPSAETIARAAHFACSDNWTALKLLYIEGGMTQAQLDDMFVPLEAGMIDNMVQLVLEARLAARP